MKKEKFVVTIEMRSADIFSPDWLAEVIKESLTEYNYQNISVECEYPN